MLQGPSDRQRWDAGLVRGPLVRDNSGGGYHVAARVLGDERDSRRPMPTMRRRQTLFFTSDLTTTARTNTHRGPD